MSDITRTVHVRFAYLPILTVFIVLAVAGCSTLGQWSGASDDQMTADDSLRQVVYADMTAEEVLEQTPRWMQSAEHSLARGDSSAAEEQMMNAILALQEILLAVPERARPVVVDSLASWSNLYVDRFGAISGDLVATSEGLSSLVTSEDALSDPDSLIQELTLDTFEVVLDTTIQHENQLPDIPHYDHRKVDNVITYFTEKQRGREAMEVWLQRAEEMIPRMLPILREHGVPEDLVYLAMIESGFRHDAHSYAAAVGPWQFISSTGKIFDLEIDWWYDERRDPELATHAASRYLRQLYEHLGDWYLALAAYNCGEGRVNREIRRSNSRDFWELSRLPRQTRNYVPTFLAARQIAKNPEQYGFTSPTFREMAPRDTVYISQAVDMDALADALDISRSEFKNLNPAIRRWCTPPDRKNIVLYLPDGHADRFDDALATVPPSKKTSWVRHTVRSGEALSTIARRYGTSMRAIMDVAENKLRNPNRIRAGQTLMIPIGPESSQGFAGRSDYGGDDESRVYIVRRGDTLSQIAERQGVGLSRLLAWNGLSKYSTIRPGQKLVVYGGTKPAASKITATADRTDPSGRPVYTVRSGDTLTEIADRHSVGLSKVLAWNGLSTRSVIHPGQKLIVGDANAAVASASGSSGSTQAVQPAPESGEQAGTATGGTREYRVRSGDTLWDIAMASGITVSQLRSLNGLNSRSMIRPGQVLKVPESQALASTTASADESETVYLVRKGDTLWEIAKQFDVSVNDLKSWNNIRDARGLKPGEKLVIRRTAGGRNG
ncbi:LysM peptidoglycan-binding domain-containing protein [bacterium]|nr:LysM peptidoglycan-binding domain-containing protein [bacterium]